MKFVMRTIDSVSGNIPKLMFACGVVLLAACASGPPEVPPSTVPTAVPSNLPADNTQSGSGATVQSVPAEPSIQAEALTPGELGRDAIFDPSSELAKRIIFFAYDSAEIQPRYMQIVTNHANYLSRFGDVRVRLEGHTDERGSREYNIALGDSRSRSVAQMLQLQGVDPGQFSTLSYGEEVPLDEGRGESAYRRNRRVEIVYEVYN